MINVTDIRSPFGSHPLVREEICLSQLNVSAAAKKHTDHSGEGEINQEKFQTIKPLKETGILKS